MTFQFNNTEDEDHQELDQLRTSHNISKLFTAPSKIGVVSTSDWKVNIDKQKLSHRKEVVGSFSHISTQSSVTPCYCKIKRSLN